MSRSTTAYSSSQGATTGRRPSSGQDTGSPGAGPSLRLFALAAVAAQVTADGDGEIPAEVRLFLAQLAEAGIRAESWPDDLFAYLSNPSPADLPMLDLAQELGLTLFEGLSVALAAAVEEDVLAGRLIARVQAPLGGSRPTAGLLMAAFTEATGHAGRPIDLLLDGAAVRSGLLQILGDNLPLPERTVALRPTLLLALGDRDGRWPGTFFFDPADEVPLPPSIRDAAAREGAALREATRQALVLRTASPAEGRSVAAALAATLDRRAVFIETDRPEGIGPWLILRRFLPVFCCDVAPGERRVLPAIPGYRGPVVALGGPDGTVEFAGGTARSWTLPVPPREERQVLWQTSLQDTDLAVELGRHHRHGSGRIAHLGRLAGQNARVQGRARPDLADVTEAAWSNEGTGLDSLAQPLRETVTDDALVTSPSLAGELNALLLRCRARDGLVDGLGAATIARYQPGVRALFVGPSGTGKTLAAGWLATRLGMPLYRVDLASVTSKYIGETEKNLAQLLARAEQSEVILLFDEADSLFGKRTDVKDANDRFANAQTNYLLQRIESFEGIVLLTSNSRARFDSAFSRRLDLVIEFALPGPEERRALWQAHVGEGSELSARDFNQLAAAADIGGGQIRNAVLTAAVIANDRRRPICYAAILEGLAAEYRKLGRQLPQSLSAAR